MVTVVVCTKWGVTLESVPVIVMECDPFHPEFSDATSAVIVLDPLPPVTVYGENPI
jgi:hypothetical protein